MKKFNLCASADNFEQLLDLLICFGMSEVNAELVKMQLFSHKQFTCCGFRVKERYSINRGTYYNIYW